MDDRRFDALTRSLAAGASRRLVLKGLLGGLVSTAAFGGKRTYAQDDEPELPETEAPVDPVVEEPAPVEEAPPTDTPPVDETAPPEEAPPIEDEPPTEETPTTEEAAPTDPPADSGAETVDEGTPADPADLPAVLCLEGWTECGGECCGPGWRCCGVYCIPDREDSCCSDAECDHYPCQICGVYGQCFPVCDVAGLECCVDEANHTWTCANCCSGDPSCAVDIDCEFCASIGLECCTDKHGRVTCAECCEHSDCAGDGSCHQCYGGYCLDCYSQTDGREPICAIDECGATVSGAGGSGGYCVQSCEEHCGPCERYYDGK